MPKRISPCRVELALAILICAYTPVSADEAESQDSPRLNLSVGHFGIADGLDHPYRFGIEYSARPLTSWHLSPNVGAVWAVNDSYYLYAGFQRDFSVIAGITLTPSLGVGFFQQSEELQLGNNLEFRSGLTIAYRFSKGYRLGVSLYHLSNGGIADHNPGTESAVVSASIPL